MKSKNKALFYSVGWNLILITIGGIILAIGIKSIAIPHGFISGGFSGLSLLMYYIFGGLSPGIWYFVLNVPLFVAGWMMLSRRFFLYSLFGMVVVTFAIDLIPICHSHQRSVFGSPRRRLPDRCRRRDLSALIRFGRWKRHHCHYPQSEIQRPHRSVFLLLQSCSL